MPARFLDALCIVGQLLRPGVGDGHEGIGGSEIKNRGVLPCRLRAIHNLWAAVGC